MLAALFFSKSLLDVHEVAERFYEGSHEDALRIYLVHKLVLLEDRELRGQIFLWIIDLYQDKLAGRSSIDAEDLADLRSEFTAFLRDCCLNNVVDVASICKSLRSTQWIPDLILFLTERGCYSEAVQLMLEEGQHDSAINLLKTRNDPKLYCQFSVELLKTKPKEIIDAWIAAGDCLSPHNLLSSLIQAGTVDEDALNPHILRYLEHSVERSPDGRDQSVQDYLLYLYLRLSYDDHLSRYLEKSFLFDPYFALRQCLDMRRYEIASIIYLKLGNKRDAISMALLAGNINATVQMLKRFVIDENPNQNLCLNALKYLVSHGDFKRFVHIGTKP